MSGLFRGGKAPSYKNNVLLFIRYLLLNSLQSVTPLIATSSVGTMFSKATLLTAIALAIFTSAAPAKLGAGISIPLRKRGSLTRSDGVFDHSRATLTTAKVQNKVRRNLSNLLRNGGILRGGVRIPERPDTAISKRQSVRLTDLEDDLAWAGTITIGSNNQPFLVDFDSELSSPFPFPVAPVASND